ncbi:MAG: RagB/SusD family nutrient uptake outer membrane protein [Mucilaginibacter sp.]
MKNYKYKVLLLLCVIAFAFGCGKKYEPFPVDRNTIEFVFDKGDSAGTKAQAFLLGTYRILKTGHNRVDGNYLDAASDDAVTSTEATNQVTQLATGSYTAANFPNEENSWAYYYTGIRRANIFINNIAVVPTNIREGNGLLQKQNWKSEARFLRSFFYFELLKRYGGVPLLGDKVYNIDDDVALPRKSFEECVNYIVSECDGIKDSLLIIKTGSTSHRITRAAALALKSRVLLFAASKLYNNNETPNTNPLLGYTNYDANRWKLAMDAASEALNDTQSARALLPDFRNVFITVNNSELIFIRTNTSQNGTSDKVESANAPIGFPAPPGRGITSPTQELVESYPMKNGLPITDPLSGYLASNPYANRDPRLDSTIFYNGAIWLGLPVETYEGGRSKPNGTQIQTRTSYYMRKFMGRFRNAPTYSTHIDDWVLFRYAEIYLNYAEAANEFSGPNTANVKDAIRALRLRAGITQSTPGVSGAFGIRSNISSTEEMREIIRNERRIEMAFEESRFFDIRRWKIAEVVMNQPRTGLSIVPVGTTYEYNRITALQTTFDKNRMYYYPIPYLEVLKNPNMVQNPGW